MGAVAAGPLADWFGRRKVIMMADVLFSAGAIVMWRAGSIQVLMVGRVVVGLGVGVASLVVPVYLSEISPIEVRGTVVAFDVLLITSG